MTTLHCKYIQCIFYTFYTCPTFHYKPTAHCKYSDCRKDNFSLPFISHVLLMHILYLRYAGSQWMYKMYEATALSTSLLEKQNAMKPLL